MSSLDINRLDQKSVHCLFDSLMVVGTRAFKKKTSQTVKTASEIVTRTVQSKGAMTEKLHHVRSSSNNQSDTATRATEEQNAWYKTVHKQEKPCKIRIEKNARITIKSPTDLCSLGHTDTKHGKRRDSTNDKTQQPQHTRRFDTCQIRTKSHWSKRQSRADDQEHWLEDVLTRT